MFLYYPEMTEKDIYTEVKSPDKRKKTQSRTADRKHDYGKHLDSQTHKS